MKCQSNIPKYEEFKFLNECQIQFDLILESLKSAKKLYLETEKVSSYTFERLVALDISPTKKYIERLCKWWHEEKGEINMGRLEDAIAGYDNLCNKKLIKETDINSFKKFDEFIYFVESNKGLISKSKQKNLIKTKEADIVIDDDKFFIISPLTHAASCIFGAGTKWCTTMKDPTYWNSYTSKFVKFYYCLDKTKDKSNVMHKFAVAVHADGAKECYDAEDKPFKFEKVLKLGLDKDVFKPENITLEKQIKNWFTMPYEVDEDGFYNTKGSVDLTKWKGEQLPIKFGIVEGNFDCRGVGLKTLEGCPRIVGKNFVCVENNLISFEFCPDQVGSFFGSRNKVKKIDDLPIIEHDLYLVGCELLSLKGCPKIIKGTFEVSLNYLESLEGGPQVVHGNYKALNNDIDSLKGFPKKVGGHFILQGNKLTSIEDFKTQVESGCNVTLNKLQHPVEKPKSVKGDFVYKF